MKFLEMLQQDSLWGDHDGGTEAALNGAKDILRLATLNSPDVVLLTEGCVRVLATSHHEISGMAVLCTFTAPRRARRPPARVCVRWCRRICSRGTRALAPSPALLLHVCVRRYAKQQPAALNKQLPVSARKVQDLPFAPRLFWFPDQGGGGPALGQPLPPEVLAQRIPFGEWVIA
jgi:hypothetical protein